MAYTDEQIVAAIEAAPSSIKEYIRSGSMAIAVAKIGEKHRLHIDTIGTLAALTRNMLVGLMSPIDVSRELTGLSISDETAKNILADLNEQVFKPIRTQMYAGAPAIVPEPVAQTPATALEREAIPQVAPQPAPQPVSPHVQTPAPAAPPVPPPAPKAETPIFISQDDAPIEKPHARTMAEDMALVKAGIYVETQHKAATELETTPATPPTSPPSAAPAPKPERPPVSAFPPPPPPSVPEPQKAALPNQPPQARPPAIHSYGIDPYREPIE